jgi:hypothetical protein
MTLNRYACKTDSSQEEIVNTLRRHGVHVSIIKKPVDLLTKWAGLWLPLEVKPADWNGKWSKKQKDQERYVRENNVAVVKTPEEALRAVGLI